MLLTDGCWTIKGFARSIVVSIIRCVPLGSSRRSSENSDSSSSGLTECHSKARSCLIVNVLSSGCFRNSPTCADVGTQTSSRSCQVADDLTETGFHSRRSFDDEFASRSCDSIFIGTKPRFVSIQNRLRPSIASLFVGLTESWGHPPIGKLGRKAGATHLLAKRRRCAYLTKIHSVHPP